MNGEDKPTHPLLFFAAKVANFLYGALMKGTQMTQIIRICAGIGSLNLRLSIKSASSACLKKTNQIKLLTP